VGGATGALVGPLTGVRVGTAATGVLVRAVGVTGALVGAALTGALVGAGTGALVGGGAIGGRFHW
jgi:hypothetical protein